MNQSPASSIADQVDRVADAFEAAWKSGQQPRIDQFLTDDSTEARSPMLDELIRVDLEYRYKGGDWASLADYEKDYPELSDWPIEARKDLAVFAGRLRARYEKSTTVVTQQQASAPIAVADVPPRIGKYVVAACLDRGGQAQVYRAVHPTLGGDVVIKLANETAADAQEERQRLITEGRVLAELKHPNIARVFDLDVHEGRPFVAMEYIRGCNLRQYVTTRPVKPREAAQIIAALARALAAAHRVGVLHLDVKPKNILIDEEGHPRLIDFGLARMRGAWREDPHDFQISGTIAYMSPEQAQGKTDQLDPRSDLFSLGGVLYFLLTGQHPYLADSFSDALSKASDCQFDRAALMRADVPGRLKAICLKAMAVDAADRYADGEQMAAELDRFVQRPRRIAALAGIAAAVVIVALVAVLAFHSGSHPGPRQPIDAPLQVEVERPIGYAKLINAGELVTGDKVRMHATIPAGCYAVLVSYSSEGKLQILHRHKVADRPTQLVYPGPSKVVPLEGDDGTEVVLLLVRYGRDIDVSALEQAVSESGPWPALPAEGLVALSNDQATILQRGKGFGRAEPAASPDPEGDMQRALETLRKRLMETIDGLSGIAFSHHKPDGG